jgi:hypothetical protein
MIHMKKASIYVFTIPTTVLMLFFSCANLNDTWVDLGSGYTYSLDSKYKKITPAWEYYNTAIYSEVTDYAYNENFIIAKQKPDYECYKIFTGSDLESRYLIYSNYIKDTTVRDFDSMRAVVKADSVLYRALKSKGVTESKSVQDQKIIAAVVDSIFHNNPFYMRLFAANENYWIIEKKQNKRIGPLNKTEFEKQCKALRIILQFK